MSPKYYLPRMNVGGVSEKFFGHTIRLFGFFFLRDPRQDLFHLLPQQLLRGEDVTRRGRRRRRRHRC